MTHSGRWRSARGQSTAMVVVMLWVLVLFVALVANVGQAVNRKIALQVIADAGAYTGASKMAEGMNYIAYANGVLQDFWGVTTWAWDANTALFATCSGYDAVNDAYKSAYYIIDAPLKGINYGYGGVAGGHVRLEADRVSLYNAMDLFPADYNQISYHEYDLSQETGFITPHRDYTDLIDIEEVPDGNTAYTNYKPIPILGPGAKGTQTQPCLTVCGLVPCVLVESWDFPKWYKRSSSDVRYFVWIAEAPVTKSLIYDAFFGPNAVPNMKAAAVARPIGGSIEKGEPKYVAEMVPVKRVMSTGGYIYDNRNPGLPLRQVTH